MQLLPRFCVFICALCLIAFAAGQTCSSSDFVLSRDGAEFLKINASNGVYTCDGINICPAISSAKQTLSLSNGDISISSGNSITLPDSSPTNELQTISLLGNTLSISGLSSSVRINPFLSRAYPPATSSISILDNTRGANPSITIGSDGLGIIAYTSSTDASFALCVFHCSDIACTTGTSTVLYDRFVTFGPSAITIGSDGLALIAAYDPDNKNFVVVHCSNVACSSASFFAVQATEDTGRYGAAAIGTDGLGFFAYVNSFREVLIIFRCDNIACSSGSALSPGIGLRAVSEIAIVNGVFSVGVHYVTVFFVNNLNTSINAISCPTSVCPSSKITVYPLTSPSAVISGLSAVRGADGLPLIVFFEDSTLKAFHCLTVSCSTGEVNAINVDLATTPSTWTDVTIGVDNLPLIFFYESSTQRIVVYHCSDFACSNGIIIDEMESFSTTYTAPSVTIGVDGMALISATANSNSLGVYHMGSPIGGHYFRRR